MSLPLPPENCLPGRAVPPWRRSACVGALVLAGAAASLAAAPGQAGVFGASLAALMIAIAVIDARSFIIPDELNLAAFLLGLGAAAVGNWPDSASGVALAAGRGALLGLAFHLLAEGYRLLRGRDGIGFGDVKLAVVAGAWLDWTIMPLAVEIAALSALAAYGVGQFALGLPLRVGARLPFGLFFAPAIWFGWLIQAAAFD